MDTPESTNKYEDLRAVLRETLEEFLGPVHYRMAGKWHGGKVLLQPENTTLQPKEIDIETFFHKLVMVRESLRVLEQKINNHEKLDDEDRVALQQYITRIYGSLTTFNVLFRDEDDRFVGQRRPG